MSAEQDIDLVIYENFFKDQIEPGIFVEVGAAHPELLSISASYRRRNWRVIAVEPNPYFCLLHKNLGNEIYQYACSDTDVQVADFYVVNSMGIPYEGSTLSFESFSSLGIQDEFLDLYKTVDKNRGIEKISVEVKRLDSILEENAPSVTKIDILAIDVEGWELKVMSGLSIDKYQPKVIVLENLFRKTEYSDFMANLGYRLWKELAPNQIYLRS